MNIFLKTYFREWNRRLKSLTSWNGNTIAQSPRKFRYLWYLLYTIYHGLSKDHRCNSSSIHHLLRIMMLTSFKKKTFPHDGSAVFGKMPPMCRGCPDVNKRQGMDTTILRQHWSFMSIKSFVQHSGWQEMVSLCSLIRLIGVCADRDQPEFLCFRSDSRYLGVHVATTGGCQRLLTHYRRREIRNSIYRYREIYIDYRSKFSYRFITSISIIYGNTNNNDDKNNNKEEDEDKDDLPVDSPHKGPIMLSLDVTLGWVRLWGFLWWAPSAKRKDHHRVSSGWSSVWHRSNTGLSSTQYEQIPIILGVWPFWLTPFFFRLITFWRAYG